MLRHTRDEQVIQGSQHDFTKGSLCLTNQEAFHERVMVSIEKAKATDVMYLDLCKAFHMLPHHFLIPELETYEFERWTILGVRSWLEDHSQRVPVNSFLPDGGQ